MALEYKLDEAQKQKVANYDKAIGAAQAPLNAYLNGVADGLGVPGGYMWSGPTSSFIEAPKGDKCQATEK